MKIPIMFSFCVMTGLIANLVGTQYITAETPADHRRQAIIRENHGDYPEAEMEWRSVLKVHPKSAEAYAHLGFIKARQGEPREAAVFYRKASDLDPNIPGLKLNFGLALFKGGDMHGAILLFNELLSIAPSESPEKRRLTILTGMAHYGLGEYAAAVPYLKEATDSDPQSLELRLALVHSCLAAKDPQCVLAVYRQILELNAESAEADMLAGEALDEMHDEPGAILQFRAAVKSNTHEPNVHFGLGYLLWKMKQYDEAEKEFRNELLNDSSHAQAMAYLADAMMHLQKDGEARSLLQKAISIDSQIALAHLDMGIFLSKEGDETEALREYKIAVQLDPNDVEAHFRLGRLYRALGKESEAKIEFDKTQQLNDSSHGSLTTKLPNAQAIAYEHSDAGAAAKP